MRYMTGKLLGPAFGRTDFLRIFLFEPPDFFADFLAGFFLLIFVGKEPRKIHSENPRENPPKFIQPKSSDTFLQIGRGKSYSRIFICHVSEARKQPKERVFGPDIPRTSLGHSCGHPGSKASGRPSKPWNSIWAQTSLTRTRGRPWPQGVPKNLGHKSFGLIFCSLM